MSGQEKSGGKRCKNRKKKTTKNQGIMIQNSSSEGCRQGRVISQIPIFLLTIDMSRSCPSFVAEEILRCDVLGELELRGFLVSG